LPAKTLRRPVDDLSAQSSALVPAMDAVRSSLWFVPSGKPPRSSEISATDVASGLEAWAGLRPVDPIARNLHRNLGLLDRQSLA
jgi:hypothetical protein